MKAKRNGPKLPAKQLGILAVARFAEPLAMTSVFPYLPEMIKSFGVEGKDVGFWAGMTSAVFSLAQSITAVPWGRASDVYGRKPVILIGLICTMICFFIWGISSSLPMAIVVRAIQGGSNGNVGIIRTMVAEMVPEKELQPVAFAIMPLVWSIGSIFGPAFGGLFAKPAEQFPGLFGNSQFLKQYPFALPNILGCVIFLISLAVGFLFLEETLASKRNTRDWGLVLGDRVKEPFTKCGSGLRRRYQRYRGTSWKDEEASAPLLSPEMRDEIQKPTSGGKAGGATKRAVPTMREVFTSQSVINLISYTILALHSVAYDQVMPVFLNFPEQPHTPSNTRLPFVFVGGFGFSSSRIGTIFVIYGIVCGAVQFLLFPPICSYFGTLRVFRFCVLLFPVVYVLTPFVVLIADPDARYAVLLLSMCCKAIGVIFGFPCTTILLTNSARSLTVLGTLNGFATTFSALGRAAGPALAGSVFSAGVKRGVVGASWWVLAAIAVVGAIPAFFIVEGPGPSAGDVADAGDEEEEEDDDEEEEVEGSETEIEDNGSGDVTPFADDEDDGAAGNKPDGGSGGLLAASTDTIAVDEGDGGYAAGMKKGSAAAAAAS